MPEPTLSRDAVYNAAPTVRVNGQEFPMVTEQMLSLEVKEHEGGLSSLELRVSNVASRDDNSSNLAFEDDQVLKLGAQIAIYGGDRNAPQEIFRGAITALEAEFPDTEPPELVVLAERSEEHTSELQSPCNLVCRLLLEKKKKKMSPITIRYITYVQY